MKMFRRFLVWIPIFLLTIFGCEEGTGPNELEDYTLMNLRIVAESDTLLLLSGDTKKLDVQGIYVKTEENTVTNTGVLTSTSFTYLTTDTIVQEVKASDIDWSSSHENVAIVSKGEVGAIGAGMAMITASSADVVSEPVYVKVSAGAPELIVDPPLSQLIFQDSGVVSGWVVTGMDLSLTLNNDTISFASDGRFVETVSLEMGKNIFEVVATSNDNGLRTTKTKIVLYYPIAQSGISGHWKGETLTRPFSFEIHELAGQYIIDGTLTVDLTILGGPLVVQDIVIAGLIQEDGTIDASLSKEFEGFTLTGTLEGIFHDSGTAEGSYTLTLEKAGWPSVSATGRWTAEKE